MLKNVLPEVVAQTVRRSGVDPRNCVISMCTDIDLLGQYVPTWIVADRKNLIVVDQNKPDEVLITISLADITKTRTVPVVGCGLLQVKVGKDWLDVARYSNTLKYPFGRAAKRIQQLARGETFELTEEDSVDPHRCPTCGFMLEFPGETCPRCINKGAAVARILELMRPYWRRATLMMILLLAGIALDIFSPLLTKFLIDNVLSPGNPAPLRVVPLVHTQVSVRFLLLLVVICLALVQSIRALVNVFNGRLASRVSTSISFDVRGRLVDHLQKLSLSYYDKQQIGSLVGRVAYDTEAVQGFVNQLTGGFLLQILMVIFSLFMMFTLAPQLAVWTLIPAPLVLSSTFLFYRFVLPNYRRLWDRSARQAGMLSGILSGVRVVKAFAQEDRELQRFQTTSNAMRVARLSVDMSSATFYPTMGLVFQTGGWIVWYVGGQGVLGHSVSLGTLMAFFGYLWMFYGPLGQLTQLTNWITQFTTQMHRIFEVLDTPIATPDMKNPVRLDNIRGDIEFDHAVFGYNRDNPILKKVSFKIEAGKMIGIVGRSGSGKTTIVNLILRFYDVNEGKILIDSTDIRHIAKHDIHRHIGVVLQEPFLFRGTIWENLTYGKVDAPVEKVIAASKAANCHDFIMKQGNAYDTWIGEHGSGLSGGERQRASMARVLLCEPGILILDEATSNVDSESELQIQQALSEVVKGRTTIAIAHRLSTLRNCDRIMVIDDGQILEQGTHPELMRLDGKYARMVRIQTSVSKKTSVDEVIQNGIAGKAVEEPEKIESVVVNPVTGLAPITSHRPRWLTPDVCSLYMGNKGSLHLKVNDEFVYTGMFALRLMPVRFLDQYISLRWFDDKNNDQEVGIIKNMAEWPPEMRELISRSLQRHYFVHTILGINAMHQFHSYLSLDVRTDQGQREFIMRYSGSATQDYGLNGKIVADIEDNRYMIPDISKLSPRDRELFTRYIYW